MDELKSLSKWRQFARGARYAFSGMRLVITHPGLWSYLAAPVVITMCLFVGLVLVAFPGFGWALDQVWAPTESTSWWLSFAWTCFWLFVQVSIVAVGALVLYFTSGLIATPFYDRLSEHVETMALGPYEEEFSWRRTLGDLAYSVTHSALALTVWLTVLSCSMMLNLMPFIGSAFSVVISAVATAVFVARESMDGALSRRRMTYRHKFRVLLSQLPMMMGFGLVMSALLWIPLLNFLVLPMGVAGGTLMYCHLEKAGLVPDAKGKIGFVSERIRVKALADQSFAEGFDEPTAPDRVPVGVRATEGAAG